MTTKHIFTFFVSLTAGALVFASVQVSSSISKFQLNSCSTVNQKCISVEADHAESGSLTPNMMLKNVVVKVKDGKNKEKTYAKSVGFYDIQDQRILISELTPQKTLKETVFLIRDASVQHAEMK